MSFSKEGAIVSIASGLAGGAIAIIRLSGKNCFEIASNFLRPAETLRAIKPNLTCLLKACDGDGRLIDRVIAVAYASPRSFTGENMLEIFCHASPYITRKIINLAVRHSARQALPGEFSLRAFENGKMDLSQAEALNDLILAESAREHAAAIRQTEGSLGKKIASFKKNLLDLLSELEVRIDDSYEETEGLNRDAFLKKTAEIKKELKKLSESFYNGRYIKDGIRISITGAPNSGKSSLLNALLGYDRAIVSPVPGTTRDTVEEKLELNGFKAIFTDTAGINAETSDLLEKEGIKRTAEAIKKADIVLLLQDGSRAKSRSDELAEKAVSENAGKNCEILRLYAKSDLPSKRKAAENFLRVSALTGQGLEKLKSSILKKEKTQLDSATDEIITSVRHFKCLEETHKNLEAAEKTLKGKGRSHELTAENLRLALSSLSDLVGETTTEELLKNIFSRFCVGK
ncbi:MAG: tRNA uridine-5-carboxymethylaminomethyl(34) synthesis GTPase MnmE [Elusimicrobia bacterium CG08_land_8_20_14_0_20_51_18]|nr:MAG: tRNA uridine-5-carboxymethylaminomethyl(34) synthesis GTPase MnmE [Elusimicrobia bacterium CG08_land_8_20_14_0_20_51_18]